ncbi:acylphosphatase [Bradyrhizobium japonicum]|uniref:acylphosphatase n=1 Tax=Bradyrhizobium japonicum TaxID=375 RepID=UPI003F49519A
MSAAATCDRKRLRVRVSGAVQGVGFRPYVYGLAMRYGLAGFVINGPRAFSSRSRGTVRLSLLPRCRSVERLARSSLSPVQISTANPC